MRLRKFIATGFILLLIAPLSPGAASFGFAATEFTQLLNHAQLVLQIQKQVEMITGQLKILDQARLSGLMFTGMRWINLVNQLTALSRNIQQGQGLAYTMGHLDQVFRQAYPGYLQSGASFDGQYRKWGQINLDTISGVLASLNVHSDQMKTTANEVAVIRNFAASSSGQAQLMQAGIMMADKQTEQLQALRQLMASQTQILATAEGRRTNNEMVQDQIAAKAIGAAHFVADN